MPFPSLGKTTQKRAITQAAANTESNQAVVTRTYADALGNITAADVRVKGQVAALTQVANASGLKLYVGGTVEIRFLNGSAHARQITGAAGGGSAAALSSGASDPAPLDMASYLAGNAPVLLQSADPADNPSGYVEAPGANVYLSDTPPATGSGGAAVNGQRLLTVRPLVSTSLPSPQGSTLPDGTLLDLVDSYGNPQGMYRLDAGAGVWRRRDAGGGVGAGLPAVTSVAGRTGAVVLAAGDVGAEPALGDPAADGYLLSSTAAGGRSWVAPGTGGSGGGVSVVNSLPAPSSSTRGVLYQLQQSGQTDLCYIGIQTKTGSYRMAQISQAFFLLSKTAANLPAITHQYWFADAAGNATTADQIGSDNLAVPTGLILGGQDAQERFLQFNGSAYLSDAGTLITGSGSYCMEFVINNPTTTGTQYSFLGQKTSAGVGSVFDAFRLTDGRWLFRAYNSSGTAYAVQEASGSQTFGLTHLVFAYDDVNKAARVWKNGVLVGATSTTGSRYTSDSPLVVGVSYDGTSTYIAGSPASGWPDKVYLMSFGTAAPTGAQVSARYSALTQ